jgi:hypothetical protein
MRSTRWGPPKVTQLYESTATLQKAKTIGRKSASCVRWNGCWINYARCREYDGCCHVLTRLRSATSAIFAFAGFSVSYI